MNDERPELPLERRTSLPSHQATDSLLSVLDILDATVLILDSDSRVRFFNRAYFEAYQGPFSKAGVPPEGILEHDFTCPRLRKKPAQALFQ